LGAPDRVECLAGKATVACESSTLSDGTKHTLDRATLLVPLEKALQAMSWVPRQPGRTACRMGISEHPLSPMRVSS